MKKLFGCVLLVSSVLAGCGSNSGSDYLGKWANVRVESNSLEIERNGDGFMIRSVEPGLAGLETKNIPATMKDGALQTQTGLGVIVMVLDKKTGNLTNGTSEFKRVK